MKTYLSYFSSLTAWVWLLAMPVMMAGTPPSSSKNAGDTEAITDLCIPWLDCSYGDGLESFAIADIDNYFTGCSDEGYGDFTWMNTDLTAGQNYNLYAETGYDDNFLCVWIDYNDDYTFTPDELLVEDAYLEFGGELYGIGVAIPEDALPGGHLMRARAIFAESASDPCQGDLYGETEDYFVNITGGGLSDIGIVSIDIPEVVSPGPTAVKVTLHNYGTATFTQQLSIINGVDYGTSTFVNDILPGETRQVTFADWNAQLGAYTFHAYFSYFDGNSDNDQLFKDVLVEVPTVNPPRNPDAQVEGNIVHLSWDPPVGSGAMCYHVYNNGTRVADSLTQTSYTDLSLTSGEYEYTISAIYNVGESEPSEPVNVEIELFEIPLIMEDFEIYSTELQLANQAPNLGIDYWECWSQGPGSDEDPNLTGEIAFEGSQSMVIQGLNDITMLLGGLTEGKYQMSLKILVPSGYDGFFGMWREVASSSVGMEVHFDESETGYGIMTNSGWKTFSYEADTWNDARIVIDLDNDWAKFFLNGQIICHAQWSLNQDGTPGPLMLDVIDFYAGTVYGGEPKSYVDEVIFTQIMDNPPHLVNIPAGWSGISSYIIPTNPDVELMFEDISPEVEILLDDPGVFWPAQQINTIGNWMPKKGYRIKMLNSAQMMIGGPEIQDKTIELEAGWNLVPVLSNDPANIPALFLGKDLLLAKEVAGCKVFWPEFGIMSLDEFIPGKAYYVLMETACTIAFQQVEVKSSGVPETFGNGSLHRVSPFTHTLAIPANAVSAEWLGSQLIAVDISGNVFGSTILDGENSSLTIFGDDPLTEEKEGFMEGEEIIFKIINKEKLTEKEVVIEFDNDYPVSDGEFHEDGISVINKIKAGQTRLIENVDSRISVYPNPATEIVHLILENANAKGWKYTISDLHGRTIKTGNGYGESYALDVSELPAGLYMIFIELQNQASHQKLLIE